MGDGPSMVVAGAMVSGSVGCCDSSAVICWLNGQSNSYHPYLRDLQVLI